MADLSTPLDWNLPNGTGSGRAAPEKALPEEFCWPNPPFASYPASTPQTDPMPCQIVGLNDKRTSGRLTFFVPEEAVAHVQIPPARTTLPLRFDQFRSLTLTTPLAPQPLPMGDPHSILLGQRTCSEYRIAHAGGGEAQGQTIGHVETDHGLYLFPPVDEAGSVQRLFVPRAAYAGWELGARIGELLVQHARAGRMNECSVLLPRLRESFRRDMLALNTFFTRLPR